jgi:hypothetical protein
MKIGELIKGKFPEQHKRRRTPHQDNDTKLLWELRNKFEDVGQVGQWNLVGFVGVRFFQGAVQQKLQISLKERGRMQARGPAQLHNFPKHVCLQIVSQQDVKTGLSLETTAHWNPAR